MASQINLNLIDPDPDQPRKHFIAEKITELAQSMQENGQAVSILLRQVGERYTIVHGERRYKAALQLGWETISADVRDISPEEAHWLSLIENIQRADLSPIEEAREYQMRLDQGMTQERLAQKIGKSRTYIAQKIRLLSLPAPIKLYLAEGAINEHHARQILRLKNLYPEGLTRSFGDLTGWDERLIGSPYDAFLGLWILRPNYAMPAFQVSDIHIRALKCFFDYVTENSNSVPQWVVASFWWASIVYAEGLTVDVLSHKISQWHEMFLSALVYIRSNPTAPKKDDSKLRHLRWWAYYDDLKHSAALTYARTVKADEILLKAYDMVINQGSYIEPSAFQSWGNKYEEYLKLAEHDNTY